MQGKRTVNRYRTIDLFLFMVILAVFETVITLAAVRWFSREAWTVTAVSGVTAIVMIRWGPWCAVHALLGGVVTALVSGGSAKQVAIYAIGNLAVLAVLPLVRKWGWKRIRDDLLTNFFFSALVVLAMQTGRALVALVLGAELDGIWLFITTDAVTYIFTIAIVWVASRGDGILEEQNHYLKRLSHEPDQ